MASAKFWHPDRLAELERYRDMKVDYDTIASLMGVTREAVSSAIHKNLRCPATGGLTEPAMQVEAFPTHQVYGDLLYEDAPRACRPSCHLRQLPDPTKTAESSLSFAARR